LSEDVAIDARGCHDDLAIRDKGPVPAGAPAAKAAASTPTAIPPAPPASQVAPSRPTLRPDESAQTSEAILVDRDQVDEVRARLYEQNLDPGAADSPEMDEALRAFQKKTGLPETGVPTRGVLQHLREAEPLKPWGAIVFSTAANRWGMSWGRPLRRQALDEATSRCGSDRCTRRMSFFGTRCGAFALSSRSWSITWRNGGERARQAALEECAKGGSVCRLVGAVCADGSERAN
jgi:hypothetical protein